MHRELHAAPRWYELTNCRHGLSSCLPLAPAQLPGASNGCSYRTQVGSLTSLFPIAYGFSKFVSGVLGARTSPTLMLSGGLMATAAVNLLFGAGNAMPWFMTFWAINGILQARGRLHPAPEHRRGYWLRGLNDPFQAVGDLPVSSQTCWMGTHMKLQNEKFERVTGRCHISSTPVGLWRAVLRAHPDHLVRDQGARHLLGHVEHCT